MGMKAAAIATSKKKRATVATHKAVVKKLKLKGLSDDGWFGDSSKLSMAKKAARQAKKAARAVAAAKSAEKEAARQAAKLEKLDAQQGIASEFRSSKNAWNCDMPPSRRPICDGSSSMKIGK